MLNAPLLESIANITMSTLSDPWLGLKTRRTLTSNGRRLALLVPIRRIRLIWEVWSCRLVSGAMNGNRIWLIQLFLFNRMARSLG